MTEEQNPLDVNPEPGAGQPAEPEKPAETPDMFSPLPVEPYSTEPEPAPAEPEPAPEQPETVPFQPEPEPQPFMPPEQPSEPYIPPAQPAQPYIPPPISTASVTPPPLTPPAPKKSGLQWWVILIIVLVVLCCCCVFALGVWLWFNGDSIFGNQFNQILRILPL